MVAAVPPSIVSAGSLTPSPGAVVTAEGKTSVHLLSGDKNVVCWLLLSLSSLEQTRKNVLCYLSLTLVLICDDDIFRRQNASLPSFIEWCLLNDFC